MKKLTFLLILVLLAATGCGKNPSGPGTTADQITESGRETTLGQTAQSEPELSEALPSDEETTAAKTAGEPETSPPPATETQSEEKRLEFDYELDSSRYVIDNAVVSWKKDGYYITGEKRYDGDIWLTWEQKALLDAGAVMNLVYEGRIVDRITAKLGELSNRNDGPVVSYKGEKWNPRGVMQRYHWQDPNLDEETRELISAEPYNGVAFCLVDAGYGKNSYFYEILDLAFTLKVSGDTPISPENWLATYDWLLKAHGMYEEMCNKAWTIEDFYEITDCGLRNNNYYFEIFEENGEVIRINEPDMRTAFSAEKLPAEDEFDEETTVVIPVETETQEGKEKLEFDYELDIRSGYVIDKAKLVREGDAYVITGEKYGGEILLTWQQKALLDAGAVMNVICEGEVVSQVTAEVRMTSSHTWDSDDKLGFELRYIGTGNDKNTAYAYCRSAANPYLSEETRALITAEPYHGVAFELDNDLPGPGNPYFVVLDKKCRVEISGDMPIYPREWLIRHREMLKNLGIWEKIEEVWTVELFYEAAVAREREDDFYFRISVEDGEVVWMEQAYLGW